MRKQSATLSNIKAGHKIGLYIRVSTEEQAENPEGSIKNQEERLKSAVRLRNLEQGIFGEIVGIYIDRAKSGKDTNRPELQRMLTAIRNQEISLVMVSELSRLSRSIKDFAGMWEMMQACKCGFLSLREAFDTTTAAGEMVLYSIANIAQFERRQVSERVSANIQARAARGLYNGGTLPIGYRLIPEKKGFLEIDPEQAKVVKAAFQATLDQGSLTAAAKWLNANGYALKRTSQGGYSKRLGHFTVQNLHYLLKNRAFLGVRTYLEKGVEKETKATWDPIIDPDTFDRVRALLKKNQNAYKPDTFKTYPFMLSGLVSCGQCGSSMCGKSAHGNGGKIPYYEHGWLTRKNGSLLKKAFDCKPYRVQAKLLEPLVWEKIEELLSTPEVAQELLNDAKLRWQDSGERHDFDRSKARIADLKQQLEILAERLGSFPKHLSPDPIYTQMAKLQDQLKEENERKQNLESKITHREEPIQLQAYLELLKYV